MTPTPRDDPALLTEWQRHLDRSLRQGDTTLEQVAQELAATYRCSPTTVRRHLDPAYGQRERVRVRQSERRRYARIKLKKTRRRNESRRRRSRHSNEVRRYQRNYRRLTRNSATYIAKVFSRHDQADLETITAEIRRRCEYVEFGTSLIRRLIEEHIQARAPPYIAEEPPGSGVYRLTEELPEEAD